MKRDEKLFPYFFLPRTLALCDIASDQRKKNRTSGETVKLVNFLEYIQIGKLSCYKYLYLQNLIVFCST